jgi:pyruvate dehydrogenase E2 component (dihydrolipoamide acetyltransferase)
VIKAAALALRNHARVNSTYRDGGIELHSRINIGVAVDTEDGSLTPVVTDADDKPLDEITSEVRNLSARARSGEITPPEQAGATFAVSNLGMLGITSSEPVVNPGQAAKLAVGAVTSRPVVRDGDVRVGEVMNLDLSCDHRVLHGGEAARFLNEVKANLEDPELLR